MFVLTPKQKQAVSLCAGAQRHTLLRGGARSGKTFIIVRNIVIRALRAKGSRHGIFRQAANACHQSIRLDTYAKVMRDCFPNVKTDKKIQDGYDLLPNGSEIWFSGLDDKERIEKVLGKEFATIYPNECSQIPYASILVLRTRLAQKIPGLKNRAYYDLNPTNNIHWTEREFIQHLNPLTKAKLPDPENYQWMQMNPEDNRDNIDPAFIASLEAMPERYKKRFLQGIPVAELEDALWTTELLERQRQLIVPPHFDRVVISIDPSGAKGEEDKRSDEIGLTALGKYQGKGYLLEDGSLRGPPEVWGSTAVQMYRRHGADCIVGESNFGGDMVRSTIHAVDGNVPFKRVTATRGKVVRAEPVSALYEMDKMYHCGDFPLLEDELLSFTTNGYKGERSPNRADSLIWAAHELMLEQTSDGLLIFYEELARSMGYGDKSRDQAAA